MSDKYCAHGFWLALGCDECRDYERLVESAASDNAMIRDLTAKLKEAESKNARLRDALEALGVLPDGYCFCFGGVRDANKPDHEHYGECREAREALGEKP